MPAHYPLHEEAKGDLALPPAEAFALLDDHRRLSAHMNASSWQMAGSSMTTTIDALGGQAVGSHITMAGRFLGVPVFLDEVVTLREPPWPKAWETVGVPRLIVIGGYCMGFELAPAAAGCTATITIDYALPARGVARWLGRVLAGAYARWCVRQMLRDAQRH
jgi:hypothetical protein